jgi:cAMP-dependent protein kinase regulator
MSIIQTMQAEIEKYQYMIETQPEERTIPLHLALGKVYERMGDKASAVQELATAALLYADQGQFIKAMAAAQIIVQLEPNNDEILERLKELFFLRNTVSDAQMQDYHETIKHIEELQSTQPEPEILAQEAVDEEILTAKTVEAATDVIAALKQMPLFAKLSVSELRGLQANSILHHVAANKPVFAGGNLRRSLFVILQGGVKVLGKDRAQHDTCFATLHAGNSFGEFALFGKIDTTLSVIAEQASTLLEIPRDLVLKLAKTRPSLTEALKDLFRRRILDNALARVPLFSQLTPQDRQKIVPHFTSVTVKKDDAIMREGEPGETMYFIAAGEAGVYTSLTAIGEVEGQDSHTEPLLLATLQSGDFFGEQALVTNEPRSATVKAHTDVTLLQFSKHDLDEVMKQYPLLESALQIESFQHQMHQRLSILKQIVPSKS